MLFHGYIKLPKLKMVKLKQHREIPPNHIIKSCTISMTPTSKYYVSILTEYEKEIVQKEVQSVVGLDFAMAELYVSSEDESQLSSLLSSDVREISEGTTSISKTCERFRALEETTHSCSEIA